MNEGRWSRAPIRFGFAGNPLDRLSERREDASFLAGAHSHPEARALLLCRDTPLLLKGAGGLDPMFTFAEAKSLGEARETAFLGIAPGGAPLFAILLADEAVEVSSDASDGFFDRRTMTAPGRADIALIDMRSIAMQGLLSPPVIGMFAQAKAVMHWHAKHGFCPNCGHRTRASAAGWRRECDNCKTEHFPRTDPVVIMLAVDGERCLLGRQKRFPKGMYSCLAGFVEPGEMIEEAVRREIHEEAGIRTGEVAYLASQPWPFPATLMIGCIAQAETTDLTVDGVELEDARWFSRDEARAMLEGRHPDRLSAPQPMAIANHILSAWVEG